jgi:chemotaxis protein MotA
MNIGTLIGFITAFGVFAVSVGMAFQNSGVILDLHAALIVGGGTVAVTLICFPMGQIWGLLKVFARRLLGKNRRNYAALIEEIVMLSEASLRGKKAFDAAIDNINDPFLQDAANVLFWIQAEVSPEELRDLLETRVRTHFKLYMSEAKIFKTMSKFPPAFGLMGTTMGMIALLQSLGSPDAKNMIGPAMAIALVATLYGLILTNFVFVPIAENLAKQTQEDMLSRSIVVEGIMLIQAERPTKYIEEKVKSYLLPRQRPGDKPRAASAG